MKGFGYCNAYVAAITFLHSKYIVISKFQSTVTFMLKYVWECLMGNKTF